MVRPDREQFRELARSARAVPVVREILADLDTPLAAFLKVDDGSTAFLFESGEGGDWGRYSFIGVGARARFCSRAGTLEIERRGQTRRIQLSADHREDPLLHLRQLIEELRPARLAGLPRFSGGAVGYLAYDWVRYVERLPEQARDTLGLPDCLFAFPETLLVHDRVRQRLTLIHVVELDAHPDADAAHAAGVAALDALEARLSRPAPAPASTPGAADGTPAWSSNVTRERYHAMVERCKKYIEAGDAFQVVPSQRLCVRSDVDPFQIYRQLRVLNPSPYLFFLRAGDHVVLGSSPEILVRLEEGRIALRPIAGTAPRGATPEEDLENERRLLADPKELAEHVMLVDLGRNDVGRVAEIGSVGVDQFQVIERYSHVMHIVSNVHGRLAPGRDAIDVLRATFPAGTLTGAPKVRAMEIIEELEPERRGLYGGAIGYIDYFGNMDMCIAIRTLVAKDGQIYVQAGGGVVADSEPEREYQETLAKAAGPLRAVALAGGAP